MSIFELALQMVLFHEGTSFVDDPNDSGGATRYGISLRFYRSKIQSDATPDTIRNLTVNDAADIYHKYFWERAPFNEIVDQNLCNRAFDLAVNIGIAHAIGCLQKAVNGCIGSHLVIDGMLGEKTLEAVNSIAVENLYHQLITQATHYYQEIVANHPQDAKFIDGWLNRLSTTPV